MKEFKQAKDTYEKTEIPEELNTVVQSAIQQSSARKKVQTAPKRFSIYKIGCSIAAALFIALTVGLNTSESFAMEMQNLPIIGSVAKLLTIRSYEQVEEDRKIVVELPAIVEESSTSENSNLTNAITDINAEIERVCDEYLQEAQVRADEYKQAFLETGGTEEEWKEHDIEISVTYTIQSQSDRYLSFVVHSSENWANAYSNDKYYNLNLQTGTYVTLQDILGENYIEVANTSILAQMKERMLSDQNLVYFDESMDGFTSITEHTSFYMNETGNPVIVFAKYEIAPGAFGIQEFEIAPSCSVQ